MHTDKSEFLLSVDEFYLGNEVQLERLVLQAANQLAKTKLLDFNLLEPPPKQTKKKATNSAVQRGSGLK